MFLEIFSTLIAIFATVLADCDIHIKNGLPVKAPVFLKSNELWTPDGASLKWKTGDTSNILCSGASNNIDKTETNEIEIKCVSNNKFTINGKTTDISTVECNKPNTAKILNTEQKCNNGTIQKIGFENFLGFAEYINVCYNSKTASVIYTYHKIPGKSIDDSPSEPKRPQFSPNGTPKNIKPNVSYKKSSQELRLAKLLGKKMVSKYLSNTSYFARGHLAPDNDGVFRSWKAATYFYINVAPQWQSVNAQNWIRVENLARKKASNLQDDLEIYTGNSGILTLENIKGEPIEISLEDDGSIKVPKYFWKILKHKDYGIAFITINNPFETMEKPLCLDICLQYKWQNSDFDLYTKGRTYCCTVKELSNIFKDDVPKEAITKKILAF